MTKLERMPNDQMTKRGHALSWSLWVRASFVIRHWSFVICWSVLGIMIVEMCCTALTQAQTPNMTGRWNIEVSFAAGGQHSLRFDAQPDGKGTLQLQDPRSKVWGAAGSSEAKWSLGEANFVTFSGTVEFLIGNVGRDAGRLSFKGKFENPDLMTGEVEFSPLVGDRPSKHGTFKAMRAKAG
jgi:hypothetical protein